MKKKIWQANNEYNTPAAVQARLKAAGINPDFSSPNGSLQGSSIQAQVVHTPSGPVADTSAWNRYEPLGSVASQALADTALSAQVGKTTAETEGQKHTNDILASDASFRDAFNQGQLDTMESTILVNGSKIKRSDAQASQARSMIEQIPICALITKYIINVLRIHSIGFFFFKQKTAYEFGQ